MGGRACRVLLVTLVGLAGCGDGAGDAGSNTTIAAAPTTTAAPLTVATTTTVALRSPLPAAVPAALTRSQLALLTKADVGSDWVEFRPSSGPALLDIGLTSRIGCAIQPSGPLTPASLAAVADGAILQKGAAKRYVSSSGLTFTDEAGAQAAINAFRSPAWSTCWVQAKTQDAKEQPGGAVDPQWRVEPIEDAGRGRGGFEGAVRFQFQAVVDGKLVDANGYEIVHLYRVGQTVLVQAAEGLRDPADPANIEKSINDELNAATGKVLKRL